MLTLFLVMYIKKELIRGVKVDTTGRDPSGNTQLKTGEGKVDDYLGLGKLADNSKSGRIDIRYKLDIGVVVYKKNGRDVEPYGKRLYRAILYVTDNPSLDLDKGTAFVTYFAYLGEKP